MRARDEWAEGRLLSDMDELEWRTQRNLDLGLDRGDVSADEMVASWAADRAAVEAESLDGEEWRRWGLPFEMRGDAA